MGHKKINWEKVYIIPYMILSAVMVYNASPDGRGLLIAYLTIVLLVVETFKNNRNEYY